MASKQEASNNYTADSARYGVKTLQRQVHFDILVSFSIFIITQLISACMTPFWRPVGYCIGWSILAFFIGIFGLFGVRKKSSALIIVFCVLLIMLACLNISHTLTMRSEHVHTCRLKQNTFRNCATEPRLAHCIDDDTCLRDEILQTDCMAPGRQHCDDIDKMNVVFAANMLISFLTFAEPTFWALLLLIRMEMTFPITPDEDDDESDTAEETEKTPLMEGAETKALDSASSVGTGGGDGRALTSYTDPDNLQQPQTQSPMRWI